MSTAATTDDSVPVSVSSSSPVKASSSHGAKFKAARRASKRVHVAPSDAFLKNLKELKTYVDAHNELPGKESELFKFVAKQLSLKRGYDRFYSKFSSTLGGAAVKSDAASSSSSSDGDAEAQLKVVLRAHQQDRKFQKIKSSILTWTNFQNKYGSLFRGVVRVGRDKDAKHFYHKLDVLRAFAERKNAPPIYDRKKQVDPDESKYGQARSRVLKYVRTNSWPEPAEETRAAWEALKRDYPFLDYTSGRRRGANGGALDPAQEKERFLSTVDPDLKEFIVFQEDEIMAT